MFFFRFLVRFLAAACMPLAVFFLMHAGIIKLVLFVAALAAPIAVFAKLAKDLGALSSGYTPVIQSDEPSHDVLGKLHPYGVEIDGLVMLD